MVFFVLVSGFWGNFALWAVLDDFGAAQKMPLQHMLTA